MKNSLYDVKHTMVFENTMYERLIGDDPTNTFQHKWRVFFRECDYDYVEDAELIAKLDANWEFYSK